MRQSLMKTFHEIYILNLHGNSLKKETCPDGSKDENVFDIRQGTAIAFFIKKKTGKQCSVCYADLYGLRDNKYHWLLSNPFHPDNYDRIHPESPFYFYTRHCKKHISHYLRWKKINEIFPVNSVGIVTARDHLTIRWTENEIWNTVLSFSKMDPGLARQAYSLGEDAKDWKVELAQKDLKLSGPSKSNIIPLLYRPFDKRYTYYTPNSRGFICRPRYEIMRHLVDVTDNLAIALSKRVEGNKEWRHVFVSDKIITHHAVSMKEVNFLFPLYLVTRKIPKKIQIQTMILFEPDVRYESKGKIPNIDKSLYERLSKIFASVISPEDILYYIYGILYSTVYRQKYTEFLKFDFPRIPFTSDHNLFNKISAFGKKLIDLHLVRGDLVDIPSSKYYGGGSDAIEKVGFDAKEKRIYISDLKYFDNVPEDVWNYQIGGYQVLKKYLDDRKNARREMDDPKYFCKIITAISKTIELQTDIDELYPEVESSNEV